MTLPADELAIPFGAFVGESFPGPPDEGVDDIEVVEDIEVIAAVLDGVPGAGLASDPAPGSRSGPGSAEDVPPLVSYPGRVVAGVELPDHRADGHAHHDVINPAVSRLLDGVAELSGVDPAVYAPLSVLEHDPADLAFWADVDVARGRLASALDLVVCVHDIAADGRHVVLTVEGPVALTGVLVSAVDAIADADAIDAVDIATPRMLLTAAGPVTTEPTTSAVVVAAARHAHWVGGTAVVFPGQEWLADDRAVSDVVDRTAIDEVRSTQGGYRPAATLRAYGYVRPRYQRGALVLSVGHDDPAVVTPWETRYAPPCCGGA